MISSSNPTARSPRIEPSRAAKSTPASPAVRDDATKSAVRTRVALTPANRATSLLSPMT